MKKLLLSICVIAISLLSSCTKDESLSLERKGTIMTLTANNGCAENTKVSMEYQTGGEGNHIEIKWKDGDKIALYPVSESGVIDYANPVLFTLSDGAGTTNATFHADGNGLIAGTKYMPVHTGDVSNVSNHNGVFKFSIPEIQHQSASGNIDHVASNQLFTANAIVAVDGEEPTLSFVHNLSALKFNLSNIPGELQSVSVTAPGSYFLLGSTLKFATDGSTFTYKDKMPSRSYRVSLTAPKAGSAEVWLLCWWNPDVTTSDNWVEDGKYSLMVSTTTGVYSVNNIPASKKFEAGNTYVLNIDMASASAVDFLDPDGTFVLNEGNMTTDNGSLIYITEDGTVIDFAYRLVNGTQIGNTTQDLFISNGKMYIIAQNGERDGGDGTLVVVDASTLKKITAFKGASGRGEILSALNWPTHVAVVDDMVYIRDNAGVYKFNLNTEELSFIDGTSGAMKNRMAVVGDKVFVMTSSKLLVLKDGAVIKDDISISKMTGILKADASHLWIAVNGTEKKIIKMNTDDYSQVENVISAGGFSAGWGASPSISAKGNSLYFDNNTTTMYRHDFDAEGAGATETLGNTKTLLPDITTMIYNMPAVHPVSGQIFFNTIKGYGWNFLTNDITVWNTTSDLNLAARYQNYTRFPAGVYFTANF